MNRRRVWRLHLIGVFLAGLFALLLVDSGRAIPVENPEQARSSSQKEIIWKYDHFDNFYGVAEADPHHVWIVGNNGRILHSVDGGKRWYLQSSGVRENLYAVSFFDARHGWCAGDSGRILRTEDGGATWVSQVSGTKQPIFQIQFLSERVGFACGYYGLVLRTVDGGKTWENKSLGEDVTLRGMWFLNAQVGFIVGEFGTILKTTNGARSFSHLSSPVETTLFAVYFSDARSGYAAGISGSILATNDGGRIWRKEDSGTKENLIGIRSNGRMNVAVGLRGTITVRYAGGPWAVVDAGTLNWLSGIDLGDDGNGYIVGGHGTILRIQDILDKGRGME